MRYSDRPPKILIIPARKHILEAYYEYIIRYLSDEFYFEMGYPPSPPDHNILERSYIAHDPTTPINRNPDDFDLLLPQFTTHFFLEPAKKYYHKMALVLLEGGPWQDVAVFGASSQPIEESLEETDPGKPYHSLRFGVDTQIFKPFPMVREDDKFHIGFVGNWMTGRRYFKDIVFPLMTIPGARLMVYPTVFPSHTRPDEIDSCGGTPFLETIVQADKWYPGLPNIYNQMDVYVRTDVNHGLQLSVMEAAACGVPVVVVESGYTKELTDAGGGISINSNQSDSPETLARIRKEVREAVIFLKENPDKRSAMGRAGRKFVEEKWQWSGFIPAWRKFFREGVANARKGM